jgi:hypothetical protein
MSRKYWPQNKGVVSMFMVTPPISIGLATLKEGQTGADLIAEVDQALNRAKNNGPNSISALAVLPFCLSGLLIDFFPSGHIEA